MNCPKCGKEIPDVAKTCAHCGHKIAKKVSASRPSTPPPVIQDKDTKTEKKAASRGFSLRYLWLLPVLAVLAYFIFFRKADPASSSLAIQQTTFAESFVAGTPEETSTDEVLPQQTDTPQQAEAPTPDSSPTPESSIEQIAFASDRGGRAQIWVMNGDGSNLQQLTSMDAGACQPTWSPDGSKIAFVSPCLANRISYPGAAIYLIDLDTQVVQQISSGGAGDYDPEWSPNGEKIAFTSIRSNNRSYIYYYDLQTGVETAFTSGAVYEYQPSWSPNADQLTFISTSQGEEHIFISSSSLRSSIQFSRPEVTDNKLLSNPIWSGDGGSIVFTQTPRSGGFSEVYIAAVSDQGSVQNKILSDAFPGRDPSISPDGKWIAVEGWPEPGNHDIWTIAIDGSEKIQLTSDAAIDFDPAWKP